MASTKARHRRELGGRGVKDKVKVDVRGDQVQSLEDDLIGIGTVQAILTEAPAACRKEQDSLELVEAKNTQSHVISVQDDRLSAQEVTGNEV